MPLVLPCLGARMTSLQAPASTSTCSAGAPELVVRNTFLDYVDVDGIGLAKIRRCFSEPTIRFEAGMPVVTALERRDLHRADQTLTTDPGPKLAPREQEMTMMLSNVPLELTRNAFLVALCSAGLRGEFDFVYVPIDFETRFSLGYAFVNVTNAQAVQKVHEAFQGRVAWPVRNLRAKACFVTTSRRQGLKSHVSYFRNSSVMDPSVLEEFKPMLFESGEQVAFPLPTRRVSPLIYCSRKRRM